MYFLQFDSLDMVGVVLLLARRRSYVEKLVWAGGEIVGQRRSAREWDSSSLYVV